MRRGLLCSFFPLFAACVTAPVEQTLPPPPPPVSPEIEAWLASPTTLLASSVVLKGHPLLYEQVKYGIDLNFHERKENRDKSKVSMEFLNVSGLPGKPMRLWIGEFQIVATEKILAVFGESELGLQLDASGDVFWKRGSETVRAERMSFRNAKVEFTGKQ